MYTAPRNQTDRQADQKIVDMVRRSNNQITPLEMMPGESDQEFVPLSLCRPSQKPMDTARKGFGRP